MTKRFLSPELISPRNICIGLVVVQAIFFVVHVITYYAKLDFGYDGLANSDLSDFFVFYSGAHFLWDGGAAAELYDQASLKDYQLTLGAEQDGFHPFNYPPTYLLVIWPLGALSYAWALILWQVVTLSLFACSLRLAGLRGLELVAGIVAPASFMNYSFGQNGFLTSALLIGGLALLARRQLLSGGLFGLLTVKPHLGLVIPFVCLAERRWLAIVGAATVAAGLIGVSVVVFGVDAWFAYAAFLEHFQATARAQSEGSFLAYSATLLMAEQILGIPSTLANLVQIAVSLAVFLTVYRAWRQCADRPLVLALTLVGVSLATPFGFLYDLPFMAVAAILVVRQGLRGGFLPYEALCVMAVWVMPFLGNLTAERGLPLVPFVHLALFGFILARLWRAEHGHVQLSDEAKAAG